MLYEHSYVIDNNSQLPHDIYQQCKEVAAQIQNELGIKIEIHYSEEHGFNVFGERFGVNNAVYIMNFNLAGDCSIYDAWEYGTDTEDAMLDILERLVCQISPDGKIHCR